MLGRLLVCAVVLGTAMPAFAGEETQPAATSERPSYVSLTSVDAMPLLLADQRATWGTAPRHSVSPGFRIGQPIMVTATRPIPSDLTSFDTLSGPAASFAWLPVTEVSPEQVEADPGFGVLRRTRLTPREPMAGSADAIRESRAVLPRGMRRPRDPLEMRLTFRLDGEESSPYFSFAGGVVSALNVLRLY